LLCLVRQGDEAPDSTHGGGIVRLSEVGRGSDCGNMRTTLPSPSQGRPTPYKSIEHMGGIDCCCCGVMLDPDCCYRGLDVCSSCRRVVVYAGLNYFQIKLNNYKLMKYKCIGFALLCFGGVMLRELDSGSVVVVWS